MRRELEHYIESTIIPQYDAFDAAHDRRHVRKVIASSLQIAHDWNSGLIDGGVWAGAGEVDEELCYVIAACHDLGLAVERKRHGEISADIIRADATLRGFFDQASIELIADAAADHRASGGEPRTLYGAIVSEADRDIDYRTILRRTLEYGLANFSDLSEEAQYERCMSHIETKYGEDGYLKLCLNTRANSEGLKLIREALKNPEVMREDFSQIFVELCIDKRVEKVHNT